MDKPLTNFSVLVTRPVEQNQHLCDLLTKAGAKPYAFPTIEISPISSDDLTQAIQKLDSFDFVIFSSTNAVKHSAELIKRFWPVIPAHCQFAAIGHSTKMALEKQGWSCQISPNTNYSSTALLAVEPLATITEKSILILTGEDPLEQLDTSLKNRKNQVQVVICYRRMIPKYSTSAIMKLTKTNFDCIICSSNATLKNLSLILSKAAMQQLQDTQIIAFSSRINDLAKELGFTKQALIVTKPSDEAIVATILENKGRLMTTKQEQKTPEKIDHTPKNIDAPKPQMLICLIAIVISVFALIEGAYVINKSKMLHTDGKKHSEQLTANLNIQAQQLSDLSNQLKQLQSKIQKNAYQVRQTQLAMESLKNIKLMNNSRWALAEIKYLLTMAQYNLKLAPAPATALLILQQVNQQLLQLADPTTLSLRQQVVTAIAELQALPTIDYAGTLMQLNAVALQLNKMPLFINSNNGTTQSLVTAPAPSGWRKYWNSSLKTLEKLVVIRHQSSAVEPMITPKEQMFLEENIQAKLSQASWALLQHNQKVYSQSLQEAIDWIQLYYTPNAPATIAVINTLQTLQNLNFSLQLPDLTPSIVLINQLIDNAATNAKSTAKGVN